jgi:hypothetical protein
MIPDPWTKQDIDGLLSNGDVEDLVLVPIAITNHGTPDPAWSEAICLHLSSHPHNRVRGNAVLGLGHLARTTGDLHQDKCLPVVARALRDADPYVRGHASSAADDIEQCLGWTVSRLG